MRLSLHTLPLSLILCAASALAQSPAAEPAVVNTYPVAPPAAWATDPGGPEHTDMTEAMPEVEVEPGVVLGADGRPYGVPLAQAYGPHAVTVLPAPLYYPAPVYLAPPWIAPSIGFSLNYSRGWHSGWRGGRGWHRRR